ncbi:MAG TPA: hypothetical protein VGH11_19155 [Jatrophihabitans sp.]|jgi:hypothetical protein
MNQQLHWGRMLIMLTILAAMFAYPIISITLDERRKRRRTRTEQGDDLG